MQATSKAVGVALWAATAVAAFGIGWIALDKLDRRIKRGFRAPEGGGSHREEGLG